MKFKWYYIAIPVGLILAYLMLKPSKALKSGQGGSGAGGTMTGAGNLLSGASKLWDSITGSSSSDGSTSDTGEG